MDELKQRMLSQAIVGEGDMIRVDMFLNHCIDMDLMERLGSALAKRFKGEKITKVLTAESSGIALACFTARALGVPVVYAKKFQTGYIDPEVYTAEIHSFSQEKSTQDLFLRRAAFGGGCINDTIIHLATSRMGFGGIGHSGMGSYHGKESFNTFSHQKSIVKKSTLLDLPVRYAPYTPIKDSLLRLFLR